MSTESKLSEHARLMRRDPTEPEKRLWRSPSNSRLGGFKFRRQAVITPFIVDFLCPAKALAVEIDGDTHDAATDSQRDRKPATQGYRPIRFTNSDVMPNAEGVLTSILHALNTTPDRWIGRAHPNSSPEGEGLQNNQP